MKKLFPFLAVLLLASPLAAQDRQSITLEGAIEMAIERSPRLKSAAIAVERNRAMRGESWEIAPTVVSYAGGQLNGTNPNDGQFAVEQSFGSLLTPFYKNALVKQSVENATQNRRLLVREIIAEVKRAWVEYIYTQNLCKLYGNQMELARRIKQNGQLRYEQGDIMLLEYKMSSSLAATMTSRLMQVQREHQLAADRLQWVCYSDTPIAPTDSVLVVMDLTADNGDIAEDYRSMYTTQIDVKRAQLQVERSRLFPELTASYGRQDILPDRGLNSWSVGVGIPLFFAPQRSRIRQADFAVQEAENESRYAVNRLSNRVKELAAQMKLYKENIEILRSSSMVEAGEINRTTELLLRSSEIDISQAIQSFNQALEIERNYLDAVNQYNIIVLEYELYTSR